MRTKSQVRMKLDPQKLLIMGLLVAAVALVCTALYRPERDGQPGWVAANEQVENALGLAEQPENNSAPADVLEQPESTKTTVSTSEKAAESVKNEDTTSSKDTADSTGKVDVNHATVEQLDALPGIGASKAKAIVADREQNGLYHRADDLLRVKGIGPKLLEKLKSFIVLQP